MPKLQLPSDWPRRGGADSKIGSTPATIVLASNSELFPAAGAPETTTASPGFKSPNWISGELSMTLERFPGV